MDIANNPSLGTTTVAQVSFNLRYPGQYFDKESGLSYNYFRSYDAKTGRYTQADPIDLQGGWNKFAYVEGNPLNFFDDDGLAKTDPNPKPEPLSPLPTGGGGRSRTQDSGFKPLPFPPPFGRGFTPGASAQGSIPARSSARDFTSAERCAINDMGRDTGCHTCGKTDPGTTTGNFVLDHQPVTSLSPAGTPQRLYPQCINCSRQQGLDAIRTIRGGK